MRKKSTEELRKEMKNLNRIIDLLLIGMSVLVLTIPVSVLIANLVYYFQSK